MPQLSTRGWLALLGLVLTAVPVSGQSIYTWDSATTSNSWLTPSNWTGGLASTWPGVTAAGGAGNGDPGDTAMVGDFSFSPSLGLAIDMDVAGGELSLGALQFTGSTSNLIVGNPSTTSGVLRLNGATVSGTSNVILANTSAGRDMVIRGNIVGSGVQNFGLELGNTNGVILISPGRTITVGAAISEASSGSGFSVQRTVSSDFRGTLILSGTNTYSGPTTVSNGITLQAGSSSALGNKSGVAVASGATLQLNGFNNSIGALSGTGVVENGSTTAATLTITAPFPAGTTFSGLIRDGGTGSLALVQKAGVFTLTGVHTYTGGTTVDNGILTIGDFNTSSMISGDISLIGTGSVTFNPGTTNNTYAGAIGGAGAPFNAFEKIGSNTLILTGASTYSGGTSLAAGTLQLAGSDDRLPTTTAVGFLSNTVLDLNGTNQSLRGVSGGGGAPGPAKLLLGSGTLTINDSTHSFLTAYAFNGVVSGTGSIVVNRGFQALSGANTYSGGTTINDQGTLRAINTTGSATGSGIVTVNAGGTLDGTGRIFSGNTGPIPVLLNGGTVSVGGGAGVNPKRTDVLTLASGLNFDGTATLRSVVGQSGGTAAAGQVNLDISSFDRNTGGAATDVMTIRLFNDGTLDLSGSSNYTITVLTYGSLGSGLTPFTNEAHPDNFAAFASNFSFASDPLITLNGGVLSIDFTPLEPVPEPTMALGMGFAGLGLARLLRKSRRA